MKYDTLVTPIWKFRYKSFISKYHSFQASTTRCPVLWNNVVKSLLLNQTKVIKFQLDKAWVKGHMPHLKLSTFAFNFSWSLRHSPTCCQQCKAKSNGSSRHSTNKVPGKMKNLRTASEPFGRNQFWYTFASHIFEAHTGLNEWMIKNCQFYARLVLRLLSLKRWNKP